MSLPAKAVGNDRSLKKMLKYFICYGESKNEDT